MRSGAGGSARRVEGRFPDDRFGGWRDEKRYQGFRRIGRSARAVQRRRIDRDVLDVGGEGEGPLHVIEIVAGLGVWFKPRLFAYVVAAWLLLIIANLLMIPGYFDVALRDFGLSLGALALARLSQEYDR